MKIRRVRFPKFRISSNPEIPLSRISERRYDLIDRSLQLSGIPVEESMRFYALDVVPQHLCRTQMTVGRFTATLMRAPRLKDDGRVHGLPSGQPVPVYPIDMLPGCPEDWVREAGSYVCPVDVGWGLWFSWTKNDPLNTAVLTSVKGMNPITGRKVEGLFLEQYKDMCPVHAQKFEGDQRLCPECGFKWPPQSYVCNPNTLWWDGFRQPDGTVRQFFFTEDDKRDIASLVIGEHNTVPAFGFAFFEPMERRERAPGAVTRGISYGGGGGPFFHYVTPDVYSRTLTEKGPVASDDSGDTWVDDSPSGYSTDEIKGIVPKPKGISKSKSMSGGIRKRRKGSPIRSSGTRYGSKSVTVEGVVDETTTVTNTSGTDSVSVTWSSSVTPDCGPPPDSLADSDEVFDELFSVYHKGPITEEAVQEIFYAATAEAGEETETSGIVLHDHADSMLKSRKLCFDSEEERPPRPKKNATVAVGAGAKIRQDLQPDPIPVDSWRTEASAVIRLYFVFREQFEGIVAKGLHDVNGNPNGYLDGLPTG